MGIMFDKISDHEKLLMEDYIDTYATSHRSASLEQIMRPWEDEKADLFKMLGNNLILEKDIDTEVPPALLSRKMEEVLELYYDIRARILKYVGDVTGRYYGDTYYNVERLFRVDGLVQNKCHYDCVIILGDTTIKVAYGSKPMRVIAKLAKLAGVKDETFEAFRIAHSMVLNTKKFKGTLCLSIHPLDFMTMSDNSSNWTSCMSWMGEGCYREGSIEMMTSPCVVIAYLKNKEDMHLFDYSDGVDDVWNNKRWRELFIVDKRCLMNIKSYPYISDTLTLEALNWIKELATNAFGWRFEDEHEKWVPDNGAFGSYKYVNFNTEYMYNDISHNSDYQHLVYLGEQDGSTLDINYSGPFVCMECGRVGVPAEYDGDSGSLVCEDCDPHYCCYECGETYSSRDSMYCVDGEYYCEYCYNDLHRDPFTEEVIGRVHEDEIYLVGKDDCGRDYVKTRVFVHDSDVYGSGPISFLADFMKKIHCAAKYVPYTGDPNHYWTNHIRFFVREEELTEAGKEIFECNGVPVWDDERLLSILNADDYQIVNVNNFYNLADSRNGLKENTCNVDYVIGIC